MRRRTTLGLVAAAALAAVAIAATGSSAGNPNTLTLAVYGDSPYLDKTHPELPKNAEYLATPDFIKTINADPSVQEVVHVGDIHSGSEPCTVAYDKAIFADWKAFVQPLIYTPGDNEWSDCTKKNELSSKDVFGNGPDDNGDPTMPLWQLDRVREIFFAHPGLTLGQNPMHVQTQGAPYVENVMWEQSKTVFVTLNIPGGSNNDIDPWYGAATPDPAQKPEMDARTAADVQWLDAAFAKAEADNAHSVVIVGQADMWDTADSPSHQTNYEPIIKAMADDTTAYGKPVLYFNGDSHIYRSDDPLQQGSTCYTESGACTDDAWTLHPYYNVPNFHRIVVHGSSFPLEWLKLKIDPRAAWENDPSPTSWGPFSWQRETQAQLTPTP